jgi:hypothetical protein
MPNIITVQDQKRHCGWRSEGGLYLRSDGLGRDCGKLPLLLDRCPVCNGGIKFGRSLTFIQPRRLFEGAECKQYAEDPGNCMGCILSGRNIPDRGWLIGVGAKSYTMGSFLAEALRLGVSKRIPQIPRDFKLGEDYVFASYKKAIVRWTVATQPMEVELPEDEDEESDQPELLEIDPAPPTQQTPVATHYPGVFAVFRPTRIEYVVRGDETDEQLERLEKRGVTCVRVERVEEVQLEMTL